MTGIEFITEQGLAGRADTYINVMYKIHHDIHVALVHVLHSVSGSLTVFILLMEINLREGLVSLL